MLLFKTMIGVHYIDDEIEPQGKSFGDPSSRLDEKDLFKPRQIVPLSAQGKCPLRLG
jgi:hypothetical protein